MAEIDVIHAGSSLGLGFLGERCIEGLIDPRCDSRIASVTGFMTLASGQFESEAVHGEKGLGEGEGDFGSRGDEKEGTAVIADGGREGQQDS